MSAVQVVLDDVDKRKKNQSPAAKSGKSSPAAKSDAGEDDEYVKALIRAELGTLA